MRKYYDVGSDVLAYIENFVGWSWVGLVVGGRDLKEVTPSDIRVSTYPEVGLVKVFLYGPFADVASSGVWEGVDQQNMRGNLLRYGDPFPSVRKKELVRVGRDLRAVVWVYLEGCENPLLLVRVTVDN